MGFSIQACVLVGISTFLMTNVSCGLNLGLISGDLQRSSSPLVIKKVSRHSPITINIRSSKSPVKLSSKLRTPKVTPFKSKPLSSLKPLVTKLNKLLPPTIPKSKLGKLLAPKIPGIPLLPPILPLPLLPIIPPLPLLPLPLPISPPVLKPLKISILKNKLQLQKALGSKLKPLKAPPILTKNIQKILLDLKKRGSLTTAEYLRFKKLLL